MLENRLWSLSAISTRHAKSILLSTKVSRETFTWYLKVHTHIYNFPLKDIHMGTETDTLCSHNLAGNLMPDVYLTSLLD